MMKQILTIALLALLCSEARAQFTFSGKIEFERKTNLYKLWEGNSWMDNWKDKFPQFSSNYYDLAFNASGSRYVAGREGNAPKIEWGLPPGVDNDIMRDFSTGTVTAMKSIYGERFLIRDSMQRLTWKMTGEVRDIAGYKCRKAVTRICDSVYVVAFYTDEIPVSSGPEQMGGLPGMILELAVPRLFTTWVATKVEISAVTAADLKQSVKGKPMTISQAQTRISESTKDWGKSAKRNIWWATL
jgi:GLPGLI family protein